MPRAIVTLAALAALVVAAPAAAAPGKPVKGDRDRDGLADKHELLAGLDPANADSDGDGVKDGREGAGRVVSLRRGVLVVKLFARGQLVRARVTGATDVVCPEPELEEPTEEDVPVETEESGEDETGVDAPAELAGLEPGPEEDVAAEDDEEAEAAACGTEDLVRGAVLGGSAAAGKARRKRWTRLTLAG